MSSVRIVGTAPFTPNWTDRLAAEPGPNWRRLEALLRSDPKWRPHQVDSVATESLRILRQLRDPAATETFQGRGLVVGYVQSGKTANYTAVSARAVDAGYRLIIVFSGIHDALRSQTQQRLSHELVGDGEDWTLLTAPDADFQDPPIELLDNPGAFLIVAKKNVPVLEKLDRWLVAAGERLGAIPTLVIDDEADQASINTRGNRRVDPAVSEEEPPREAAPSRTNAMIRSVLSRLPKATYVAYTATPFANILIDPFAVDREVGEDLFPKDFAVQLARPDGYTGTEELFGVTAQGRDVLRMVPDADVAVLKTKRTRRPVQIDLVGRNELLPESLADALLSFCIAGAVRELRPGFAGKPHTMLVHVSPRIQDQSRIAAAIREQLDLWIEAVRQGQDLRPLLRQALTSHMTGVELPADEDAVLQGAVSVLRQLEIVELNSATGENLEYDIRPARHLVAVGGNRLSRGLTLEGLTISFFLRTATMADALLQMARWYGFRTGYEDLIRIWTTDGIARWFTELALVEQSLRDSIVALGQAGRRPDQMGIRLRAHSELMLTARNKSANALSIQDSWSGEHPQTVLLPLGDPGRLTANRALAEQFVSSVVPNFAIAGGWLAQDIPAEMVCGFLQAFQVHNEAVAFRPERLVPWIARRSAAGELTDWNVFLAGSAQGAAARIGGQSLGLVTRSRVSRESIGILIDPRHEGVDLPGGPDAYRRPSGAYDAELMRAARSETQGLLILYPLDPAPLGVGGVDAVIGLALSLPRTADASTAWVVNRELVDD
ncbi:Z1 domain-containing protein [Caulobacter sp. AP07]|uniref:Z1 domain-containing protein n=1 Tax=Caulobacter sp. AP07 TaxID=1144304 RepID=UPI000271E43E|nr:Z1 domain-containing protein [Caulobacter sp. AP07]EJL23869.1 Z1 domain-containing protein [Caulobacter sp. AP07]